MNGLGELLARVWEGKKVYRETFAMIEEDGACSAPFLYRPETVLKIESYDGTQAYELGGDCVVKDGRLALAEGSRIPHTGWDTFYHPTEEEARRELESRTEALGFGPVATTDGRFLNLSAIGNPSYITRWQLAVTYETNEVWTGPRPESAEKKLPRFFGKALSGEPVTIVLYGDSISCGCDSSGLYGLPPGQPIWPKLLEESLKAYYKGPVRLVNTSVGGQDSDWAIRSAMERACAYEPDLVILGFGMNDRCSGQEYLEKTRRLRGSIRSSCPDAEYVLMATTLPNELTATAPFWFQAHQGDQAEALWQLEEEGTAVADVQNVQRALMKRKRYFDITGNMLNHPNDYLARIQGQVLDTLLKPGE
mgnify:FL=1